MALPPQWATQTARVVLINEAPHVWEPDARSDSWWGKLAMLPFEPPTTKVSIWRPNAEYETNTDNRCWLFTCSNGAQIPTVNLQVVKHCYKATDYIMVLKSAWNTGTHWKFHAQFSLYRTWGKFPRNCWALFKIFRMVEVVFINECCCYNSLIKQTEGSKFAD
jgi:hypothetical protein